ncbi:hypothetical protein HPP92_023171 [Vanilla planifolia]|uniref:Pentatricopeptide repeat-containing protein n=1 Tax=Vanilla planifolia TaxID=51239 RepID=A0A835PQZ8_VANPL|nr:hypothetical protein HPP92_023171 [Vanilla planifolia]
MILLENGFRQQEDKMKTSPALLPWRIRSYKTLAKPFSLAYSSVASSDADSPCPSCPSNPDLSVDSVLRTRKPLTEEWMISYLLKYKHKPASALGFFKRLQLRVGEVLALNPLCVLLHLLVHSDMNRSAKELLWKSLSAESSPRPAAVVDALVQASKWYVSELRTFDCLLFFYVHAGRLEDAMEAFGQMAKNQIFPGIRARNDLLAAFVRVNSFGSARDLYREMVALGMELDCCTCDIMMHACLKEGKPEEADAYFSDVIGRGVKADALAYTKIIQAVCKEPHAKRACEILSEMKMAGFGPSEFVYITVIGACVKEGNLVDALRLKDEMLRHGLPLSLVVATTLMKGYCLKGDLDGAFALVSTISEMGIKPNNVTYAILIEACCKHAKDERAYDLYCQMKKMGMVPNVFITNSVMLALLENGKWAKVLNLFDEAVSAGIANVFTYNDLLYWFSRSGKLQEACALWAKMEERGVEPTVVSYNNLLLAHCKLGDLDAALNLFSKMRE